MSASLDLQPVLDAAARAEVVQLVQRVADALHGAGLEPSRDLADALLYLGLQVAQAGPEEASSGTPAQSSSASSPAW